MFKFIHAADIHLDSPLVGLSSYQDAPIELLRGATRRAFANLVDAALREKVAFVVIAGDVYDGEWKDFNTGLFFARMLGRLRDAGVEVVLLHGNHDAESNLTRSLPLPPGVHVFSSKKAETFVLDGLGVALHGRSFKERETTENLVPGYPDPLDGLFNVGVLHTALEGNAAHASYAPCSTEELRNKGYDYWALGHVHVQSVVARDPWIVFPGNLQGRHARELGPKGAMLVTVDEGRIAGAEPLAVDVVRWAHVEVDATGAATRNAVEDRAREALAAVVDREAGGRTLAVRITVRGACRAHAEMLVADDAFVADLRAIGAGLAADELWVEKVRLETRPDGGAPAAGGLDAADDLARLLAEAPIDRDLLEALEADLRDLVGKLPSDIRTGLEPGPLASLRDGRFDDIVRDATPLLLARIKRGG